AGCELNVAIRTVEFDTAGNAVLGSGGGITADSDPDAEWDECLHKAAPIIGITSPISAPLLVDTASTVGVTRTLSP
ncbi:MAG: chorismate-binding protein, partial [Mycobacterium sp.]